MPKLVRRTSSCAPFPWLFLFNVGINSACTSNPCLNNGNCEIADGGFVCHCVGLYWGTRCEDTCKSMFVYSYRDNKFRLIYPICSCS